MVRRFLLLGLVLLASLCGGKTASAFDARGLENRVWEKIAPAPESRQQSVPQPAGLHQEKATPGVGLMVGCSLAAETAPGSFSVIDWTGYPEYLPKPTGPMRLLDGAEYDAARDAANAANKALRQGNPGLQGWDIHEIQPVKFGGSPTDIGNKIPLPSSVHQSEVTPWWNQLQRDISP